MKAAHLSALEDLYDRRLHADLVNFVHSDSFKGLEELGIPLTDSNGRSRDPDAVIGDVFQRLISINNDSEKRTRLERVILGDAMPLAARKDFEEYCVGRSESQ